MVRCETGDAAGSGPAFNSSWRTKPATRKGSRQSPARAYISLALASEAAPGMLDTSFDTRTAIRVAIRAKTDVSTASFFHPKASANSDGKTTKTSAGDAMPPEAATKTLLIRIQGRQTSIARRPRGQCRPPCATGRVVMTGKMQRPAAMATIGHSMPRTATNAVAMPARTSQNKKMPVKKVSRITLTDRSDLLVTLEARLKDYSFS